jgi:hypothetical protein
MNKKVPEQKDSRSLPAQRSADCVSGGAGKPQSAPAAGFIKARAKHPGRQSLSSCQILNSTEICSRFEQLSGRGEPDALDAEGINQRQASGTETPKTI